MPLYRILAGLIGIAGLTISFMHGTHGSEADLARRFVLFFSMFTNLTNMLVTLALLLPVVLPNTSIGRFFTDASVRSAIAGYIIVVGVVYHFLLAPLWQPEGLTLVAMVITHYVVPVLFVIDWMFLTLGKAGVAFSKAVVSLIYPVVYLCWTLVHGAITSWYPYPFLDVAALGYATVLGNVAGLIGVFLVLQLLLVGIGRLIGGRSA